MSAARGIWHDVSASFGNLTRRVEEGAVSELRIKLRGKAIQRTGRERGDDLSSILARAEPRAVLSPLMS